MAGIAFISNEQSTFGQKIVIPIYFEASNLTGPVSDPPVLELVTGFVFETYLLKKNHQFDND
jgi:hypothetical protein